MILTDVNKEMNEWMTEWMNCTLRFKFVIRYGFQPTEFSSFMQTLTKFTFSHCWGMHQSPSLSEVHSDKFRPGGWQNATYVPGYFRKKYTLN